MGFASGRDAVDSIWQRLDGLIHDKDRRRVAQILVDEFENLDTDDWDYEPGSVLHTAYPERCVEEDEE